MRALSGGEPWRGRGSRRGGSRRGSVNKELVSIKSRKERARKKQLEFRPPHARITWKPRANLPPCNPHLVSCSHSICTLYACSDSYAAQLQPPQPERTQGCQHLYPSNTPTTELRISRRTLPLSSTMSITLQVHAPRYAPRCTTDCG